MKNTDQLARLHELERATTVLADASIIRGSVIDGLVKERNQLEHAIFDACPHSIVIAATPTELQLRAVNTDGAWIGTMKVYRDLRGTWTFDTNKKWRRDVELEELRWRLSYGANND